GHPAASWQQRGGGVGTGTGSCVEEFGTADGSDAVHEFAGGVLRAVAAGCGTGRRRGGDADRGADAGRDGEGDRIFREHAGTATGFEWESAGAGVVGASEADGVGSVCTSAGAV